MKDHKKILIEANTAITHGDYEGFLSYCTEDTEWTFVGEQTLKGKEAVKQWMAKTYIEPPMFTVDTLIAEDPFITALGTITLKNNDGTESTYSYCDVWRFSDGKMAALKAFVVKI